MRVRLLLGLIAVLCGGCRHPMQVCTNSRISVPEPVAANVSMEFQPKRNQHSLVEMTVDGTACPASAAKVVVIDVDGLLVNYNITGPYSSGENPLALLREKLNAVAADPCVGAVVVRVHSAGGGVTASDMMWHEVHRFRQRTGIPVVAYLMDVAAGGGYYLATAADTICAHPTSVTGGIGVVLNLYSLQDTMAQFNVIGQTITAGEKIDMGSAIRPMEEEERALLQAMADQYYERFKQVVVQSRPRVTPNSAVLDGRVMTAQDALTVGLIDNVGYLEDAVAMAATQGGLTAPKVVILHRPDDPARTLYAVTPNSSPLGKMLPLSIPGLDRTRLPMFLYMWQVDPTLPAQAGM